MTDQNLFSLLVSSGNIIAALLSWKRNRDLIWSIIAFFLGWVYCFYWFISEEPYTKK